MRIRQIKPGIMTNEDLPELGPYAEILFTHLWMMADKAGRLPYRPARIKALAMPFWTECPVEKVVEIVDALCAKGMLRRYFSTGGEYLAITNWAQHQRPDTREPASKLPPPPPVTSTPSTSYSAPQTEHGTNGVQTGSARGPLALGTGNWELGIESVRKDSGGSGDGGCREEEPPPPFSNEHAQTKTLLQTAETEPETNEPHQATMAAGAGGSTRLIPDERSGPPRKTPPDPPPPKKPPTKPPTKPTRKPPGQSTTQQRCRERPPAPGTPVDWWPFQPHDVDYLRQSLNALGALLGMPPPDDELVRRVLDACNGADVRVIHETLRNLFDRRKFRSMHSWGLLPVVLRPWFSKAS